jgi:hypothetical protein
MHISDLVPWRTRGRVRVRQNDENDDDQLLARRQWGTDLFDSPRRITVNTR